METLKKVIATLGNIEVHGKNNLDMLLGCIIALEGVEKQMEADENDKIRKEAELNEQ